MSKAVAWDPDARTLLDKVCADMPFFVRAVAHSAVVAKAEERARKRHHKISREDLVIAAILATPPSMYDDLRDLLARHRIPLSKYKKYFTR